MSLFAELKRRNVIRVAIAYVVLSWLMLQMGDLLFDLMGLPDWANRIVLGILVLGFVPALIVSWVYELTPSGIRRESEIEPGQSVTLHTARKLDIAVIVLLILAIASFFGQGLLRDGGQEDKGSGSLSVGDDGSAASTEESEPARFSRKAEPAPASDRTAEHDAPSIAVLPFANMSTDPENGYFAEGISEEILNLLSDVAELSVASRTSAFGFRGKDTPIPEIASALGVRFVLEGSVRKAGEQVRITAQLIDATSDRHLWSETYDRTLDDIFAIQDEIAAAIGQALQVQLLGEQGVSVQAEAMDPAVYARFLEARHVLRQRGEDNVRKAMEMLIGVVEQEPGFARGHLLLGEAYLLANDAFGSVMPSEIANAQARMHAEMARAIDPDLAGIYLILGKLSEDDDLNATLAHYSRAIELEPSEPRPYHWRAVVYLLVGHLERALSDAREAVRLEPENVGAHGALGVILIQLGRDAEAIPEFDNQVATWSRPILGLMHLKRGDLEPAAALLSAIEDEGQRDWWQLTLDMARDPAAVDRLRAEATRTRVPPSLINATLLALGLFDDYLSQPADRIIGGFDFLRWSDELLTLRSDPRFVERMQALGIVDVWRTHGPPPDCRPEGESFTCGLGYPEEYAADGGAP